MFAVTSRYSMLKNDFFLRDRRLLAEFGAADNRLKTKGSFV